MAPNDRDLAFKPNGGTRFPGRHDARGRRAGQRARLFQRRRIRGLARGQRLSTQTYVTNYDPKTQAAQLAAQNAQAEAIRSAAGGHLHLRRERPDHQGQGRAGFETSYTYDFNGNLTSITDANGCGAHQQRQRLLPRAAHGARLHRCAATASWSANLTAADKTALLAKFTSTFTYDAQRQPADQHGQRRQRHDLHLHGVQQGRRRSRPRWATSRRFHVRRASEPDPRDRCAAATSPTSSTTPTAT